MYYLGLINIPCFVLLGWIHKCSAIETYLQNDTADRLWNLSKYALQSRQALGNRLHHPNGDSATRYLYNPSYYTLPEYPIHPYASPYPYQPRPHNIIQTNDHYYDPYYQQAIKQHGYHPAVPYYPNPERLSIFKPPRQSVMDVLYSVARNDDLQCVPKIICEVTSESMSGRQSGLNLPVAINMQSLIGFFSALNGVQSSPLFYFAKAALLGYSLKGNSGSCGSSFPDCPADPDRLIQYLNNHNGGFFRFFGGLHPSPYQQDYAPFYQGQKFRQSNFGQEPVAEERIQNKASNYLEGTTVEQMNGITFPSEEFHQGLRTPKALSFPPPKDHFSLYKTRNPFKFPEDNEKNNFDQPFRKPKELPYDLSFYQSYELDLQKALPNHKANPMIFPDRTGTGELRLDLEDLDDRYQYAGGFNYAFNDEDSQSQRYDHWNGRGQLSFPE